MLKKCDSFSKKLPYYFTEISVLSSVELVPIRLKKLSSNQNLKIMQADYTTCDIEDIKACDLKT